MADVIIIGGGMVGAALAAALSAPGEARQALDVVVVEAGPEPAYPATPPAEYDLRVSAISPASQRFLDHAGAWSHITARRVCPFRYMRIWDVNGGDLVIDAADGGAACLGHIVENRLVQTAAWEACVEHGATVYPGRRVARIEPEEERPARVVLDDGTVLDARLVVAADGARSPSRQMMDIDVDRIDYHQSCMVGTVSTELPHQSTAWQRFRPEGPAAFLPLADGRVSIAWYESPERCRELLAADEQRFAEALARETGGALGRVTAVHSRASFPLALMHARRYVRPRFALVGDAAHTIHPMAGQGVNLGLMDAAALAEVVRDAHALQRDFGAYATLRRYERWRKGDNLLMLGVIDSLKRLYESPAAPLRLFRNQGMNLVNALRPLKRLMMTQAMGERSDLPRWTRV